MGIELPLEQYRMMEMALTQVMFESMNILEVPGLSWVVILMVKLQMIIQVFLYL